MASWSAAILGVAFILLGAGIGFRSVERFYDAYIGPPSDDLSMRHIVVSREPAAWVVALGLIAAACFVLKFARRSYRTARVAGKRT